MSPSALSHGVGLPVSDGGAGAASRALGQVAGAASQIGATLKRKDEIVQNNSAKLAGERIQQDMDDDFEKVQAVLASKNYTKAQTALEEFNKKYENIDVNRHINTDDGEVPLREDRVKLISENYKTTASGYHRQLYTKSLNLQTKDVQMAQVTESAQMTRDIVSQSTESSVSVADVGAALTRMVDGYNHESVAGYQADIQGDFAEQADSVVDAFIRSAKFSEAPETLPEQIKELQQLLGDEQVQSALGTAKAGTLIDRLSESFKQAKEKPDYTALANTAKATVDDLLGGTVDPANTNTYQQYRAIRHSMGAALRDPNTPKDVLNRFTSLGHALDIRTKFDYNDQGARKAVHEWFTNNPDADGDVVLTSGALEKLGIDVGRLGDTERTALGAYFKRFAKEVNDVTKEFGDFEGQLLVSGSIGLNYAVSKVSNKFPEVATKAQAALSEGDPATVKKLGVSLMADLGIIGQGEYPLISTLTEYVGEEGRSPQEISAAVSLITAMYGPKRMANFIGDHSAPESPVHGKELANLMSVQSVADPKARVSAASWVAKGGDPASNLTKSQLNAYKDAQSHLQARIKGSVDYSGRRVVDPKDPISSLRPIPTALAKVTQGLISEGDAPVAQFYETMYNGILVQEIAQMEPSEALNPVKVVERAEAVMNSIFSFTTLQNGTVVIGQSKNIPKKWSKDGVSTEDGVQFAWHKAVNTAEKEIGVVKQFRNIHAENPNDDLALAEYKAKMREIESDEDFLESIINEDIVRPDGSVGPVIRWGLPSGDKQERTLLMYNPNTTVGASKWEPLVKSDDKAYTISDVSLYSGITADDIEMYHSPIWNRFKKNFQRAFFGRVKKEPEVDPTFYRGGVKHTEGLTTFSDQFGSGPK